MPKRTRCRSCFASDLQMVNDFGLQPLAGFYATDQEAALNPRRYPLVLEACPQCELLQITTLPPIEEVFHDDYTYSSSQIPPLVTHFAGYAAWLTERVPRTARVLEFGCNDGVLLDQLRRLGFQHLNGVDASPNIAAVARARGFEVVEGFFGQNLVEQLSATAPFDLISCSNVFAHIDDLQDVLSAAHRLLGDSGQICIEVHDAEKLILEGQFETIYHEHLSYFSAASLRACLALNHFEVVETATTPMHGGGLRVLARKAPHGAVTVDPGKRTAQQTAAIGSTLRNTIASCNQSIWELHAEHGPLDGFGMAGRAQMFLSMTETETAFTAFFDDAPIRQNRYAVGTDKIITAFKPSLAANACVILAWNYADTIIRNIEPYYAGIYVMFPGIAKLK